ncbi:MAG: hypothetical protein ACYC7D_06920 [Nitrososphaerales archaeon]
MSENKTTAQEEKKPDAPPKKKYMVPGFYWNSYQPKSYPPAPSPLRGGFVNTQQKKFYLFMTVFKIAKVAAIILVALVIIGWI